MRSAVLGVLATAVTLIIAAPPAGMAALTSANVPQLSHDSGVVEQVARRGGGFRGGSVAFRGGGRARFAGARVAGVRTFRGPRVAGVRTFRGPRVAGVRTFRGTRVVGVRTVRGARVATINRHRVFRNGRWIWITGPAAYGAYAYSGGCGWLRARAAATGSRYWWRRYNNCLGRY